MIPAAHPPLPHQTGSLQPSISDQQTRLKPIFSFGEMESDTSEVSLTSTTSTIAPKQHQRAHSGHFASLFHYKNSNTNPGSSAQLSTAPQTDFSNPSSPTSPRSKHHRPLSLSRLSLASSSLSSILSHHHHSPGTGTTNTPTLASTTASSSFSSSSSTTGLSPSYSSASSPSSGHTLSTPTPPSHLHDPLVSRQGSSKQSDTSDKHQQQQPAPSALSSHHHQSSFSSRLHSAFHTRSSSSSTSTPPVTLPSSQCTSNTSSPTTPLPPALVHTLMSEKLLPNQPSRPPSSSHSSSTSSSQSQIAQAIASPKCPTSPRAPVKETHHVNIDVHPVTGRRLLNTYEVIKQIGRGQHGKVKLAQNSETGELVAIKIVDRTGRPKLGRRPGTTHEEKVRREIAIMKKCSHPNIVELKEVLDDIKSNKIYLVLEYLECGEILWSSGEGSPLMTIDQSREVARDVISGLEYLHFQGIIHRDIKPANLLRDKDGNVKISDFGVSYASSLDCPNDELELAKTAGTPAFFAPELCVSTLSDETRPPVTYKIDIWAFGVTLYCLLFGKVPFIAESEFELFDVIVNQPLTFPDEEPVEAPKEEPVSCLPPSMFYNPGLQSPVPSITPSPLSSPEPEPPKAFTPIPHDPQLESAKDLLRHLLDKNPTTRYDIIDIKQHPWMLQGMDLPGQELFLTKTQDDQRIEVTNEEVQTAVLGIAGRIKRGLSRLGSHALHITGLRRKGSTSSSSSFTQASSTSTSRSNSRDPPVISRRGSRDAYLSKTSSASSSQHHRIHSIAHEIEYGSVVPPRPNSGNPTFSESLFNMLDREVLNKSANSSSTSLSSSMSSGAFPTSPRMGIPAWKQSYGSSRDHHGHARTMRALSQASAISTTSDRLPERRASVATACSVSTQDSFPQTDIEPISASAAYKPSHTSPASRPFVSSHSNLNINALLEEPILHSSVPRRRDTSSPLTNPLPPIDTLSIEPTAASGLDTPKADSSRHGEHFGTHDDYDDLTTPSKSSYPPFPRSPGSPLDSSMFLEGPIICEPTQLYNSCSNGAGNESRSSLSSNSSSGSSSSEGELVLNMGARLNAPSSFARRLGRISDSNLRAGANSSRLSSAPTSPVVGAVSRTTAQSSRPPVVSSIKTPPHLQHLLPQQSLLKQSTITNGRRVASRGFTSQDNTSTSSALSESASLDYGSPKPRHQERQPYQRQGQNRARSHSVMVGEIQHLRVRDNFGLDDDEEN